MSANLLSGSFSGCALPTDGGDGLPQALCAEAGARLGGDHLLDPAVNLPAWQPFRRNAASCTVNTRRDLDKSRRDLDKSRRDLDKSRRDLGGMRWDLDNTRWDLVKTRRDFDNTRRDFVKTSWDFVKTRRDLVKTRRDLGGTRWDFVKTRWDFVKTRCDFDKTRWDFVNTRWDLDKTRWDFGGTRWDLGGTRRDLNSSYPIHNVVLKALCNHKTFQHKHLAEVGTSMRYQCEKPGVCSYGVYAGGTQTMLGTEGALLHSTAFLHRSTARNRLSAYIIRARQSRNVWALCGALCSAARRAPPAAQYGRAAQGGPGRGSFRTERAAAA